MRLIPIFLKRAISTPIEKIAGRVLRDQDGLYFASNTGERSYCIKKNAQSGAFPVPPRELWVGYGYPDEKTYLAEGRKDATELIRIVEASGFPISQTRRILEFGCAAGRMIRHFMDLAPKAELWGVDIGAGHIRWCINNLSLPIHFATTTLVPHLPFEDRNFDLIFCGSIFTHIEDLQEAWLLELGRILRPGGRLYLTIHDENTVRFLATKYRAWPLAGVTEKDVTYQANKRNFDLIVLDRGTRSQVFYSSSYFRSICPPIFRWLSLTPEAFAFQSAVLLEKI